MASTQTAPDDQSQSHLRNLRPLVMGGAGFSYQLHPDPESLPVRQILLRAFDLGLRVIDTSPYYEPSEQLIGAALNHPDVTSRYARSDYLLMTKAGRIAEKQFNYSPAWIRDSVARSLDRFQTSYLDVVFCHDVEFVSTEEALGAVGALFDMARQGSIRSVGISGYDIDVLVRVASLALERYGRPIDVVQNWAQLTLQNTRLEQSGGFKALRQAGVQAVVSSSPLAVGLLRDGGLPVGRTGDWHPAPQGLRDAAQEAAQWMAGQEKSLASLALRFAIARAQENTSSTFTVTTATGVSSFFDLEENVKTAETILKERKGNNASRAFADAAAKNHVLSRLGTINEEVARQDLSLVEKVRSLLGHWIDYDFGGKGKAVNDGTRKQGESKASTVPTIASHI